jgi:nitrate reductase gamma subunit
MYLLEKGMEENDDKKARSERRIINGIFLILAGASMMFAPNLAAFAGIEAHLSFDLILASLLVLCAGIAMLIGGEILKHRTYFSKETDALIELK